MSAVDEGRDSIGEYHARQQVNIAENEAGAAKRALSHARGIVREVRKRLEEALEHLDQDADQTARDQVVAALDELAKLRF